MKTANKLTLSALTAAIAMATGAAHAAIVLPSTGDGELFLTAWDSVRNVSYSRQFEINLSAFTGTGNLSFAGDALFASTFTGSVASDVQWNVVAADNTLPPAGSVNTNGNFRVLTTSTAAIASGMSITNAGLNNIGANINNFVIAVNNLGCDVNVSCATSDPNDFGFGGISSFGTHLGLVGGVSSTGTGFGSTLNFWYITGGGGNIATQTSRTRFNEVGGPNPATWSLASDGSMYYTATVVPVPAAVWLLGSGLLGLVGIARRRPRAVVLA